MILRRLREAVTVRWQRTLYITFFAQFITAVGFSSIFPFLTLYVKDLGAVSNLSIEVLVGLVFSAQAFTMMITAPIWGTLADRFGRKLMVERAMFGGAVLLLLMAFARSAEELVILRAIQGLVTGSVAAASALVASVAPRDQTGYAMGLLQVGLSAGVAFGPLLGGVIADEFGYSVAFYITAGLLLLSGLLILIGVEEEFVPVGVFNGGVRSFMSKWRGILAARGVPMAYGMRFMNRLGRMMIFPIIPLFIETLLKDVDRINSFTGLVIGAEAACMTVSAIYLGKLGDRVGHRRIIIMSTVMAAVLYLLQSLVVEGWQLLILQCLAGVAMGGILPGISALLARYTRIGDEGAVFGLDSSIQSAARSVAPMLGAGVAVWFNLRATFTATSLLYLVAGLLAIWRLHSPEDIGQTRAEGA
jgi:DHA1 family multidrug resistance protein-like MFS transporter